MVPWERLPEEVKELNRDMVRALPACLAKVGLRVYRTRARSDPPSGEDILIEG
jgi:hypothetical protein